MNMSSSKAERASSEEDLLNGTSSLSVHRSGEGGPGTFSGDSGLVPLNPHFSSPRNLNRSSASAAEDGQAVGPSGKSPDKVGAGSGRRSNGKKNNNNDSSSGSNNSNGTRTSEGGGESSSIPGESGTTSMKPKSKRPRPKPSAALLEAKRKAQERLKSCNNNNNGSGSQAQPEPEITIVMKDHLQPARDMRTVVRKETGVVYDMRMVGHECPWDPNYPEKPERFSAVVKR
jgi:hypothetical protein